MYIYNFRYYDTNYKTIRRAWVEAPNKEVAMVLFPLKTDCGIECIRSIERSLSLPDSVKKLARRRKQW